MSLPMQVSCDVGSLALMLRRRNPNIPARQRAAMGMQLVQLVYSMADQWQPAADKAVA